MESDVLTSVVGSLLPPAWSPREACLSHWILGSCRVFLDWKSESPVSGHVDFSSLHVDPNPTFSFTWADGEKWWELILAVAVPSYETYLFHHVYIVDYSPCSLLLNSVSVSKTPLSSWEKYPFLLPHL